MQYEKEIAKEAKERQKQAGGDRKSDAYKESLSSNLNEPIDGIRTAAEAAKMVGTSAVTTDEVFRRKNRGRSKKPDSRSDDEFRRHNLFECYRRGADRFVEIPTQRLTEFRTTGQHRACGSL